MRSEEGRGGARLPDWLAAPSHFQQHWLRYMALAAAASLALNFLYKCASVFLLLLCPAPPPFAQTFVPTFLGEERKKEARAVLASSLLHAMMISMHYITMAYHIATHLKEFPP